MMWTANLPLIITADIAPDGYYNYNNGSSSINFIVHLLTAILQVPA